MGYALFYKGNRKFSLEEVLSASPNENEVQIRVSFCGICYLDRRVFAGAMDHRVGLHTIIGHEISGEVIGTGSRVKRIKTGDRVVIRPLNWCGRCPTCEAGQSHICENLKMIGLDSPGGLQEVLLVPERIVYLVPEGVSLERAALTEPLAVAFHDVGRAALTFHEYALVIGGGIVGTMIALILKSRGIPSVLLETDPARRKKLEELGLKTKNPRDHDLREWLKKDSKGKGVDVVFEVSASEEGAQLMSDVLKPRGRIILVGIFSRPSPVNLKDFFRKELEMRGARVYTEEDFESALEFLGDERIPWDRIVGRVLPLAETEEGFRLLEKDPGILKLLVDCRRKNSSEAG